MYKMGSAYLKAPITSDRVGSTSDEASGLWQRLAADPEMTPTEEFDHFRNIHRFDTKANGYAERDTPRTPSTEDDCRLVSKQRNSFERALTYTGSMDLNSFIERHREAVLKIAAKLTQDSFENRLTNAASFLFYGETSTDESFSLSRALFQNN